MGMEITATAVQSRNSAHWSEPLLDTRLVTMLDDNSRWRAGSVPVLNGAQIAIVEKALAEYRSAPAGTSPGDFARLMAKLAASYPMQRVTADEADLRMEVYGEQLRSVPFDMLDAARIEHVRTSKFFPSAAELHHLAYALPRPPRIQRQARLAKLVEAAKARAALAPPADLADPTAVAALVERLGVVADADAPRRKRASTLAANPPASRPLPSVDDYVAQGLTSDEARNMVELQARAA